MNRADAILAVLRSVGGRVSEHELDYQLRRRGFDTDHLLDQVLELEQDGKVESELYFTAPKAKRRSAA